MKEMWTFNKKKSRLLAGFMAFVLVFSNIAANVQTVYAFGGFPVSRNEDGEITGIGGYEPDESDEFGGGNEEQPRYNLDDYDKVISIWLDEETGEVAPYTMGVDTENTLGQELLYEAGLVENLGDELPGVWTSSDNEILDVTEDGAATGLAEGVVDVTFTYQAPVKAEVPEEAPEETLEAVPETTAEAAAETEQTAEEPTEAETSAAETEATTVEEPTEAETTAEAEETEPTVEESGEAETSAAETEATTEAETTTEAEPTVEESTEAETEAAETTAEATTETEPTVEESTEAETDAAEAETTAAVTEAIDNDEVPLSGEVQQSTPNDADKNEPETSNDGAVVPADPAAGSGETTSEPTVDEPAAEAPMADGESRTWSVLVYVENPTVIDMLPQQKRVTLPTAADMNRSPNGLYSFYSSSDYLYYHRSPYTVGGDWPAVYNLINTKETGTEENNPNRVVRVYCSNYEDVATEKEWFRPYALATEKATSDSHVGYIKNPGLLRAIVQKSYPFVDMATMSANSGLTITSRDWAAVVAGVQLAIWSAIHGSSYVTAKTWTAYNGNESKYEQSLQQNKEEKKVQYPLNPGSFGNLLSWEDSIVDEVYNYLINLTPVNVPDNITAKVLDTQVVYSGNNGSTATATVIVKFNITAGANDDFSVQLLDGNKTIVNTKLQRGKDEVVLTANNLKANQNYTIKVEGSRILPNDVYFYLPKGKEEGEQNDKGQYSQSFIGMGEGEIPIDQSFDFSFQPKEDDARGGIKVVKTGEYGHAIAGAEFELWSHLDGFPDQKIETATTNENGIIEFSGLLVKPGLQYYVKETKAASGYVLDTNNHYITVERNKVTDCPVGNKYEKGSLTVSKTVEGVKKINGNDPKFEFEVKLTLSDANAEANKEFLEYLKSRGYTYTKSGNEVSFKLYLQDGESKTIDGIPAGTGYSIRETNLNSFEVQDNQNQPRHYTSSANGTIASSEGESATASGTIENAKDASAAYKNTLYIDDEAEVSVTKMLSEVVNNDAPSEPATLSGSDEAFEFTLTESKVDSADSETPGDGFTTPTTLAEGQTSTVTASAGNNGAASFKLKYAMADVSSDGTKKDVTYWYKITENLTPEQQKNYRADSPEIYAKVVVGYDGNGKTSMVRPGYPAYYKKDASGNMVPLGNNQFVNTQYKYKITLNKRVLKVLDRYTIGGSGAGYTFQLYRENADGSLESMGTSQKTDTDGKTTLTAVYANDGDNWFKIVEQNAGDYVHGDIWVNINTKLQTDGKLAIVSVEYHYGAKDGLVMNEFTDKSEITYKNTSYEQSFGISKKVYKVIDNEKSVQSSDEYEGTFDFTVYKSDAEGRRGEMVDSGSIGIGASEAAHKIAHTFTYTEAGDYWFEIEEADADFYVEDASVFVLVKVIPADEFGTLKVDKIEYHSGSPAGDLIQMTGAAGDKAEFVNTIYKQNFGVSKQVFRVLNSGTPEKVTDYADTFKISLYAVDNDGNKTGEALEREVISKDSDQSVAHTLNFTEEGDYWFVFTEEGLDTYVESEDIYVLVDVDKTEDTDHPWRYGLKSTVTYYRGGKGTENGGVDVTDQVDETTSYAPFINTKNQVELDVYKQFGKRMNNGEIVPDDAAYHAEEKFIFDLKKWNATEKAWETPEGAEVDGTETTTVADKDTDWKASFLLTYTETDIKEEETTTYWYQIKENLPSESIGDQGFTYTANPVYAKVDVKKSETYGKLDVTVTYYKSYTVDDNGELDSTDQFEGNKPVCVNVINTTTFDFYKRVDRIVDNSSREDITGERDEEYIFNLSKWNKSSANWMQQLGKSAKANKDSDWKARFELNMAGLEDGEYWYKISENLNSDTVYTSRPVYVKAVVSNSDTGELNVDVVYYKDFDETRGEGVTEFEDQKDISFVNTENIATLNLLKRVTMRTDGGEAEKIEPEKGFEFELFSWSQSYGDYSWKTVEKTVADKDSDWEAHFSLNYVAEDAGLTDGSAAYWYKLVENLDEEQKMDYVQEGDIYAKVVVERKGLDVTTDVTYYKEIETEGNEITGVTEFDDNGKAAPTYDNVMYRVTVNPKALKTVIGYDGTALEKPDAIFTFQLYEKVGEDYVLVDTAQNDGDGNVDFRLLYTGINVGTHTYRLLEVAEGGDYRYDTTIYDFTVEVSGHGSDLKAETSYDESKPFEFANDKIFTEEDQWTPRATKTLNGQLAGADGFTFELKDEAGNVISTATSAGNGSVTFATITYGEGQDGVHTYTMNERVGSSGLIIYDAKVYTVTVTVEKTAAGNRVASVAYTLDGAAVTDVLFENQTRSTTSTTPNRTGTTIPDNEVPQGPGTPDIITIADEATPLLNFETIEDEDVPLAFLAPMTGDNRPVGAAALFGLLALGMMGAFGILASKKDEEDA